MDIPTRIRTARLAKGLSLRAMAKMLGVSPAAVSQWESGTTGITVDNRVNLSDVLGIPISDLMPDGVRRNGDLIISDPQEILLIERWRTMPPLQREAYLRLLVLQTDEGAGKR